MTRQTAIVLENNEYKHVVVAIHRRVDEDANLIELIKVQQWNCLIYAHEWRKMLYNTLVLPHFDYVSTILWWNDRKQLDRLHRIQNRAMRLILRCNRVSDMLASLLDECSTTTAF
jgi:hypothetical protein